MQSRNSSWLLMIAVVLASSAGCAGTDDSKDADEDTGGGDTDADADADGDADTDADADSDSDSDTQYSGPSIPATCDEAAEASTSVGCEFFVVDADNCNLCDAQTYAVVVSNPQEDQDVTVTLQDGSETVLHETTLAPGQLEVMNVACGNGCLAPPSELSVQGIGVDSGFRLASDYPILAYQWNPYGAGIESTDASLLLPTTSLTGTYIVAAWGEGPGIVFQQLRSQITIIATADDTHLTFTPSVDVPDQNGVGPCAAGAVSTEYTLDAYDVLMLSPQVLDDDLTGTAIEADKPVAVFGGHSCGNIPDGNYGYCDHVEEQMLPLAAWGTNAVLGRHQPRTFCTEQQDLVVWRIIAGTDAMHVTFDPPAPAPAGASYSFAQQGDLLEFHAPGDYYVEGVLDNPEDPAHPEAPFFAYQLMMGAEFASCGEDNFQGFEGDPMMVLSPPAGQYLDRYVFTTDNVFDFWYDHIIVVKRAANTVELDCAGPLPQALFTPIGTSEWEVGRFFVDNPADDTGCLDGAHSIWGEEPFGLVVAGTAPANSYGYPGGLAVANINPFPEIE